MAETKVNQAAIDLIDSWLAEPPMREVKRWEWKFYRGRHGCRDRYLLPSIVIALEENCIQAREGFVTVRWWKWEAAISFDEFTYATEPINPSEGE